MIVLGIDPGTVVMGYGVVEDRSDGIKLVDCGAIISPERSPVGERLCFLYQEIRRVIRQHRPEAVAIEQPFVSQNVRSALAIGRAQAVAMLAASLEGVTAFEYSPAQIKQRVANYGASSKEQIQEMVRLQLGLAEVPKPSDAADALAVAICHLAETHYSSLLARQKEK